MNLIVTIAVVVVAVLICLVLLGRCNGDNDRDGKKGLDWERHPVAKTFESSHRR